MPFQTVKTFIGIGSNLKDPPTQIQQAIIRLSKIPFSKILKISKLYWNVSLTKGDPDFLNGVILLETSLAPETLLDYLHQIENEQGRERNVRWGPRTLDLDIILYGDKIVQTERLSIPHRELVNRNFWIFPIVEMEWEVKLSGGGSLRDLDKFHDEGLVQAIELSIN